MSTLYSISSDTLTGLADAVRSLTGESGSLSPSDMIDGIEGHVCPSPTIQSLSVTQNGEYVAPSGVDGYSPVTVNVSGGGGASNVVIGEFTASADNAAQDVNIPYTGNGYIVFLKIGIKGGLNNPNATYGTLVRRYATGIVFLDKNDYSSAPTYNSGASDLGKLVTVYKSSSSSSASYSTGTNFSSTDKPYSDTNATNANANVVKIRSKNKLSIFSATVESTNYGFLKGQTYEYVAVYSE